VRDPIFFLGVILLLSCSWWLKKCIFLGRGFCWGSMIFLFGCWKCVILLRFSWWENMSYFSLIVVQLQWVIFVRLLSKCDFFPWIYEWPGETLICMNCSNWPKNKVAYIICAFVIWLLRKCGYGWCFSIVSVEFFCIWNLVGGVFYFWLLHYVISYWKK
jgi:hypothetical protein